MKPMRHLCITLLFSIFLIGTISARTILLPPTECDTLITHSGQTLIVSIVKINNKTVRFYQCGDPKKRVTELPFNSVKEIRPNVAINSGTPAGATAIGKAIEVDSIEEKDRRKMVRKYAKIAGGSGMGAIFMLPFSAAFSPIMAFLILPLMIVALIFGSRTLKLTKRKKTMYRKERKLAIAGIVISASLFALLLAYIVVIFLFLILWL